MVFILLRDHNDFKPLDLCSVSANFWWRVGQVEIIVNDIAHLVRNRDGWVVRVECDVEVLHIEFFSVHLGFRDLVVIIVLRRLVIFVLLSLGILFILMVLLSKTRL